MIIFHACLPERHGISHPQIKIAAEIEKECQLRTEEDDLKANPIYGDKLASYSFWFQQAYPSPKSRQTYLRKLIERKPISNANLRLAHILISKKVTNVCVTPNFDDFMSRALYLFGEQPIICDHPMLTDRIDTEDSRDIKIIHVHGSFWFYDCCNLLGEINTRAQQTETPCFSMNNLLERFLSQHAPIVVGYSGWEGDVIMASLRKRLEASTIPYNIYWFCYKEDDVGSLPLWLINHQNVFIISPPTDSIIPKQKSLLQLDSPSPSKENDVLSAQQVFEEFIRQFDLPLPDLLKDPISYYAYYAKKIKDDLIHEYLNDNGKDIYNLIELVKRIDSIYDAIVEQKIIKTDSSISVEKDVADLAAKAKYLEVIHCIREINLSSLADEKLRLLFEYLVQATCELYDNMEETINGYTLIVSIYDTIRGTKDLYLQQQVAIALRDKGFRLGKLARNEESIATYNELLRRFGDAKEPVLQEQVAGALCNKGIILAELGNNKGSIITYDDLARRFGDTKEPALQEQVAKALYNKGVTLTNLGRSKESILIYDELLRRFVETKDSILQRSVAMALFNKGVTLEELGCSEQAIDSYNELIRRFGNAKEPIIQREVAMALRNQGVTLGNLGRSEEATVAFNDLFKRFSETKDLIIQQQVAMMLVNKGVMFGKLGRCEEAIAMFDELLNRFGAAKEPEIQEEVMKALVNKGTGFGVLGRYEEEIAVYDALIEQFGEVKEPNIQEQVAMAFVNKGLRLGKFNRIEEEIAAYNELIKRFGEGKNPAFQKPIAIGLCNKGLSLAKLGHNEEAIATFDELIKRFGIVKEPDVQRQVEKATTMKIILVGRGPTNN